MKKEMVMMMMLIKKNKKWWEETQKTVKREVEKNRNFKGYAARKEI